MKQQIRLHVQQKLAPMSLIILEKEQTHYLRNVMRSKVEDVLCIFNNQDGSWHGRIIDITKNITNIEILKQISSPLNYQYNLRLCFAPIKGSGMNNIIRQSTELGINAIQPIQTQRTMIKKVNPKRIEQQLIEASEQSNRIDVPELEETVNINTLYNSTRGLIICDETGNGRDPQDVVQSLNTDDISLIIGPEGGFTPEELSHHALIKMSLGTNILKCDTAAITAIAYIKHFMDLKYKAQRKD